MKAWNKGLTKETDERVAKHSRTLSERGIRPYNSVPTPERRKQSSIRMKLNNPVKDQAVREKIRNSLLKTYKEHPEILSMRRPCGINQYSNHFTSIEQKISEELDKRNVQYIHNFRLGRYFVDFLIFENVIIECDGEYWHNDTEKELRREKFLHSLGYFTFHLSGKRIKNDPAECIDTVLSVMNGLNDYMSIAN